MNWTQFVINLAAAFALGSLIGAERQWRQRMAGLRTNALVAIEAAMFVMLAMSTPDNTMRVARPGGLRNRLPGRRCDHA